MKYIKYNRTLINFGTGFVSGGLLFGINSTILFKVISISFMIYLFILNVTGELK